MDHNADPRADLDKYGPAAVSKGKITQVQLDELHRQEAAHQNAMVHYPVFLASVAFAQSAGLPNATINRICLAYTLIRVAYGFSYVKITSHKASYLRSLLWWASNVTCFVTLWKAGKTFNKV